MTPGWNGDLVWDITMGGPDDARVTAASFSVNGTRLLPEGAHDQCTNTDTLHYSGTTAVSLAQQNLVTARADWYTTPTTGTGCRSTSMEHQSRVWQTVTIDQIQWGAAEQGVWVHASDGFGTHIHLWMDDMR
jgi:Flp pilus assembly protein TadG